MTIRPDLRSGLLAHQSVAGSTAFEALSVAIYGVYDFGLTLAAAVSGLAAMRRACQLRSEPKPRQVGPPLSKDALNDTLCRLALSPLWRLPIRPESLEKATRSSGTQTRDTDGAAWNAGSLTDTTPRQDNAPSLTAERSS